MGADEAEATVLLPRQLLEVDQWQNTTRKIWSTPKPKKASSQAAIAQIRCPLLVCYGANEGFDPTADIELIRRNAIAARSIDTRLFEGANHGYDHHEREVAEAIADWIDARG